MPPSVYSRPDTCATYALPAEDLGDWPRSSSREWIVTNGIGGYASGTLSGANTRCYHGFLTAALDPPGGRTVLSAVIEETVQFEGRSYPLSSTEWWDETVSPRGYENLEGFRLENGMPVFSFLIAGHLLEKRIWMEHGENTTWASYSWPETASAALLSIKLFFAQRSFHASQHGDPNNWHWKYGFSGDTVWTLPWDGARKTVVKASHLTRVSVEAQWYWGFFHRIERERGLDGVEDLWTPGAVELTMCPGERIYLLASSEETVSSPAEGDAALQREQRRREALMTLSPAAAANEREACLLATADSFLIRRPVHTPELPPRPNSIIAGYHWFEDWGRDTMISLPGLTLTTGRPSVARDILVAYSAFVSDGMLPNRFPDSGAVPEYNTVDATLWYFISAHRYVEASGDHALIRTLFPCLKEIIDCHVRGTRHGIRMDSEDGLLRAGEGLSQLTWMDAKVGDWVVTPRLGKPVEIAALWYNALRLMSLWAAECGENGSQYTEWANLASDSFERRFWIPEDGYLCDVIDAPDGDDRSFRPNQLFALSLPQPLLDVARAKKVVDACGARLLTPSGLRTLDPADPRYIGHYGGDAWHRDGAYHQGTVWAWLIGAYVDAVLYAYGDVERCRAAVDPILDTMAQAGIGTVSEIFDGDFPYTDRGCMSQAWSVAELLRSLERLR